MPVERSGLGSTILSVAGCQRDHVPRNQYALEMQIMAVIPTETRGETHEKLILDRPEIIEHRLTLSGRPLERERIESWMVTREGKPINANV